MPGVFVAAVFVVVVVVMAISAYHVATLVHFNVEETASRGQLLAQLILQRTKEVVAQGVTDPYGALRTDGGIRSIIESSTANWPSVNYVAIVDAKGVAVVHNYSTLVGTPLAQQEERGRRGDDQRDDQLEEQVHLGR